MERVPGKRTKETGEEKDYDFWLQREIFLHGVALMYQNHAKLSELHEELARLHEETRLVTRVSQQLKNALNKPLEQFVNL